MASDRDVRLMKPHDIKLPSRHTKLVAAKPEPILATTTATPTFLDVAATELKTAEAELKAAEQAHTQAE